MATVTIVEMIQSVFPVAFLTGFGAGFIVCSSIYVVRAAVRLFVKTVRAS